MRCTSSQISCRASSRSKGRAKNLAASDLRGAAFTP